LEDPVADEPQQLAEQREDSTISAAELMAMTREERAALGFRTVRDPENLPPALLDRVQARVDKVVREDREREASRHAS
jgi:hypothetical protein